MVHFASGAAAPDGSTHAARPHAASNPTASAHTALRLADADDLDRIGEEIASLAAHIHAAQYQLLALLAEFDERDGWSGSGFRSCSALADLAHRHRPGSFTREGPHGACAAHAPARR